MGSLKQTHPPPPGKEVGRQRERKTEREREREREREGLFEQSINKYDLFCISPWTGR